MLEKYPKVIDDKDANRRPGPKRPKKKKLPDYKLPYKPPVHKNKK